MELNEALEIAGKMKHFFRAFEKLEDVLTMVSQSEGLLPVIAKRQEDLVLLNVQIKSQEEELAKKIDTDIVKYGEFQRDIKLQKAQLKDGLDYAIKENQLAIDELNQKKLDAELELKNQIEADINSRGIKIGKLDAEIKIKEARLNEINKNLEDIKSKF